MLFWISVPAYLILQVYAAIKCRGRWRVVALLPLAWMVPVVSDTAQALRDGSNLWPCLLIPAGLGTAAYLGVLVAVRSAAEREREPQGFDVLPPPNGDSKHS